MPIIDLKTAAAKIRQIVEQRKERGQPSPFFFIVGAGISQPEIPLAWEIEEQCRREANKYGRDSPPLSNAAIISYSHWMNEAFPSAEERQIYLRCLMESQPISKANLRLAHLLLNHTIARTLFTPNFDDMLTKALRLFGEHPIVCDHPLTVDRMRMQSDDTQIIHVHGSYWHYDCCNLMGEIEGRAGSAPMTLALYDQMRQLSPIVVGYSGWEGDIIMSAIRKRLDAGRLANPIFWFCFRRNSMDNLPNWLTVSPDVLFVLPDEAERSVDLALDDANENGLKAVQVFDALITGFGLSTPQLTQDPLGFFASQLRSQLGTKSPEKAESDTFYSFHTVIERVERAAKAEKATAPDELQGIRDAMGKADYRGAVRAARLVQLDSLPEAKLKELLFVLVDASARLHDNSDDEIAGYDLATAAGAGLAKLGPVELQVQKGIARSLYGKGHALGELNRSDEALAAYGEALRYLADVKEPGAEGLIAQTLVNRGVMLSKLNRSEEALAAYDDVLRRFADSKECEFREPIAKALHNKGYELWKVGREEEGVKAYDEVASRFSDAQDPLIREMVARALVGKGFVIWKLNKLEEAIAVHDDFVRRFADAPEPEIRKLLKIALLRRAIASAQLRKGEEGIAACGDVVDRFAEDQEPTIRELVAYALYYKVYLLWGLTRREEAIATWDEVERRFPDAQEAGIREWVGRALNAKGSALEDLGRNEDAAVAYDEVVRGFADSREEKIENVVKNARDGLERLSGDDPDS